MSSRAIITGSGPRPFSDWAPIRQQQPDTPYGIPVAPLSLLQHGQCRIWLLPRHGNQHQIPPHLIDYRSNLAALKAVGVTDVVAVCAVGAIDPALQPGQLVFPDQLIDYSWGRCHTIVTGPDVRHVDFREPYTPALRQNLLAHAKALALPCRDGGVYAVAQGPRYETRAEIARMARDGCCVVGMTGMPEAGLARELELAYASVAIVMNPASGMAPNPYDAALCQQALATGMQHVERLISRWLSAL